MRNCEFRKPLPIKSLQRDSKIFFFQKYNSYLLFSEGLLELSPHHPISLKISLQLRAAPQFLLSIVGVEIVSIQNTLKNQHCLVGITY